MLARRGRQKHLVRPGQMLAWDPSAAHSGRAADDRPWFARLIVVEVADLAAIAADEESPLSGEISIPDPLVTDPRLRSGFIALHRALEAPLSQLERDERLGEWLHAMLRAASATRPQSSKLSPRDDRALRIASDYLGATRNVSLDELAAAAGIGKFRLVRIFRKHAALPPHALQLAHRLRHARRLLEQGQPIARAAAESGFSDQSHLHRHFRRSLWAYPLAYQRRFRLHPSQRHPTS